MNEVTESCCVESILGNSRTMRANMALFREGIQINIGLEVGAVYGLV